MVKGFLQVAVDGGGDTLINLSDISYVFPQKLPGTSVMQCHIILKSLGPHNALLVNCEFQVLLDLMAIAAG